MKTLFGAFYNPMIHESCFELLSLHRTSEGAEKAIELCKSEIKKEWLEIFEGEPEECKWDEFKAWKVQEIEIKD